MKVPENKSHHLLLPFPLIVPSLFPKTSLKKEDRLGQKNKSLFKTEDLYNAASETRGKTLLIYEDLVG
jgi:hypothetical protein